MDARSARRGLGIGVLLALGLLAGCAGPWRLRAAGISESLAGSVERVQTTVMDLHAGGVVTDVDYTAWQAAFRTLADVGLSVNAAIRAGDGQTLASQATIGLTLLDRLIAERVVHVPEGARALLLVSLEGVRSVLLSLAAVAG